MTKFLNNDKNNFDILKNNKIDDFIKNNAQTQMLSRFFIYNQNNNNENIVKIIFFKIFVYKSYKNFDNTNNKIFK